MPNMSLKVKVSLSVTEAGFGIFISDITIIEIKYNILSFVIDLDIEKKTDDLAAIPTLPKAEIVKRLRERGHPILLFGETLTDACERLKQIEMDAPDSAGTQSSGITNDFKYV